MSREPARLIAKVLSFVSGLGALSCAPPAGSTPQEDRRSGSSSIRLGTLNLHGYHPMMQPLRSFEYRDGRQEPAPSDLFYFSLRELEEGERVRQKALSQLLLELDLDIIAFQEVGAGLPGSSKTCDAFEAEGDSPDALGVNTLLRLKSRPELKHYSVSLACRGNTGWRTSPGIFKDRRIVTSAGAPNQGLTQVVWDFDSNPYPNGLIVEGLGLMFKREWRLALGQMRNLKVGPAQESFSYQVAALEKPISQGVERLVLANIHGGHKVRNFEQAAAVRLDLVEVLDALGWPQATPRLVLGDINEGLPRGSESRNQRNGQAHVSDGPPDSEGVRWYAAPWEFRRDGLFDLTPVPHGRGGERVRLPADLVSRIEADNRDSSYKSWATVSDAKERVLYALRVLEQVYERTAQVAQEPSENTPPSGALPEQEPPGLVLFDALDSVRSHVGKTPVHELIDHIFVPAGARVTRADSLGQDLSWKTLSFVSDHPLIWAEVTLPNP